MNLDRGPCKSREPTGYCKGPNIFLNIGKHPSDYTRALGRNEIAYIKSHAIPRMNYYRSLKTQEHPDDGLDILAKYMKVAPYLIPQSTNEAASNDVLMHPDLHLDNIFVDPEIKSHVLWTGNRHVLDRYYIMLLFQRCVPTMGLFRRLGRT